MNETGSVSIDKRRRWPLTGCEAGLAGMLVILVLVALASPPAQPGEIKPRPAPKLPDTGWLNTEGGKPLRLEDLRGKVVLVEFWTFACYNCRNVLPHVKAWYEKYAREGLVVIGVHTPELDSERQPENVKKAVKELGITFPVVLDNDYATWDRYHNQYWPALYLIDSTGQIVYLHEGEGAYAQTEARIQQLLAEAKASAR